MFLDRTEDDAKNTNKDSKQEKATRPYLCPWIVLSLFESMLTEAVERVHKLLTLQNYRLQLCIFWEEIERNMVLLFCIIR